MKKLLYSLLGLILSTSLTAQSIDKVKLTMGQTRKHTMKFIFLYQKALGHDQENYFGTLVPWARVFSGMTGTNKNRLYTLDRNLNASPYTILEHEQDGKDTWDEFTVIVGEQLYGFFSFQNKKLKKDLLFARLIDKKNLTPTGEFKIVAEIDYSKSNKYKTALFGYSLSPDSSKILISYGLANKDGMLIGFGFNVLNDKMDILWGKENELPSNANKVFGLEEYCLTNNGDVFLLSKIYDTRKDFKQSERYKARFLKGHEKVEVPNFAYTVFTYRNGGKNNQEFPLELKDRFLRSLKMGACSEGQVVCAGFFGEKESLSVTGCCSFVIRSEGEPSVHQQQFDFSLLTKGMDPSEAGQVKKDMENGNEFDGYLYNLPSLVFRKDGGFWLAGEQTEERVISSRSGTTYTFIHDNAWVAGFGPDGEILWTNKLVKRQKLQNQDFIYASLKLHGQGDKLYVIFNDISVNSLGIASMKKGSTKIAEYGIDGTESIRVLTDIKSGKVLLCPRYAGLLDDHTVVCHGQKGAKYRFAKITFD